MNISSNYFNVNKQGEVEIIDSESSSLDSSQKANLTIRNSNNTYRNEILPNRIKQTSANASACMWTTKDWGYMVVKSDGGIAYCRMISAGSDLSFVDCSDGINTSAMRPTGIETPVLTQTSTIDKKKNIEKLEVNTIDLIKNADICTYNFKSEKRQNKKHIGLIIGEGYNCPDEVVSENREGIEQYSMTSLAWKAIQELIEKNENLEKRIERLEAK